MVKPNDRYPSAVFTGFLKRVRNEVYSEPDSELHTTLIDKLLHQFISFLPDKDARILDVGCGQGYACLKFKKHGYSNLTAITLSEKDVLASNARGFACHQMDISFLEFDNQVFDALWVRHPLEHSPFPYLTLLEFNRVLSKNGVIYIEMPAADTPRELENWQNHYSIMGRKMWIALMAKSGFNILLNQKIQFMLQIPNINHGKAFQQENIVFVLKKTRHEAITTYPIGLQSRETRQGAINTG